MIVLLPFDLARRRTLAIQVNIPAVVARNLEIVKRISMEPTEPIPGPFSPPPVR